MQRRGRGSAEKTRHDGRAGFAGARRWCYFPGINNILAESDWSPARGTVDLAVGRTGLAPLAALKLVPVFTPEYWVWLGALNISVRNWMNLPSRNRGIVVIERSQSLMPRP